MVDLHVPIVGAPLAGGPSTPALAAAVSEAGGLGFLAAGYKAASVVQRELEELRTLTARPIGLNVFFPVRESVDEQALADQQRQWRTVTRALNDVWPGSGGVLSALGEA